MGGEPNPFMDPIEHDLYMFIFFDRHIPIIYLFIKDFLRIMINNLDVIPSRVQIQLAHYFPLQIIQRLQFMTYHHVVAFDTLPSKWEFVNPSRIVKGSTEVYIYINILQRL